MHKHIFLIVKQCFHHLSMHCSVLHACQGNSKSCRTIPRSFYCYLNVRDLRKTFIVQGKSELYTLLPNATFYRIMKGFNKTLAMGVARRQGTLTPPDTWSRPIGLALVLLVVTNPFPKFVVFLVDYALRTYRGTVLIASRNIHMKTRTSYCNINNV